MANKGKAQAIGTNFMEQTPGLGQWGTNAVDTDLLHVRTKLSSTARKEKDFPTLRGDTIPPSTVSRADPRPRSAALATP
ncbi:hypothetical protein [Sphingobium cloacae]|uniref:hypothetical protein n=1 Tax=Sphingobium cloacae TaxID=120107 RepID=UPI001472DBCB|nr:hypothetical protein [Sphingobium cloacae]